MQSNELITFVHMLLVLQLPIVLFLAYFSYQASRPPISLGPFQFIWIGWISNCVYIVLQVFFSDKEHSLFVWGQSGILQLSDFFYYFYKFLIDVFDFASCYFILIGTRQFIKIGIVNKIVPYKPVNILIGFVLIISLGVFHSFSDNLFLEVLYYSGYSIITFISYLSLSQYFMLFQKKYGNIKSLYYGAGLFCLIQLLVVINIFVRISPGIKDNLEMVGFGLGALSKAIIVYGLHELFLIQIAHANEYEIAKKEKEKLFQFLAKTFHEITKPIDGIELVLNEINKLKEDKSIIISSRLSIKLQEIERFENHISAIVTSSSLLLTKSDSNLESISIDNWSQTKEKEFKYYSINTILESCIIVCRKYLSGNQKISTDYAKRCDIFCNIDDALQIFFNVIKNAVESLTTSTGVVFVRTRTIEKDNVGKTILIEIEDDGIGIPFEIQDLVFTQGFSTKSKIEIGRGFGLAIVKDIVQHYNGEINFISPLKNNHGTKFVITLPSEYKRLMSEYV